MPVQRGKSKFSQGHQERGEGVGSEGWLWGGAEEGGRQGVPCSGRRTLCLAPAHPQALEDGPCSGTRKSPSGALSIDGEPLGSLPSANPIPLNPDVGPAGARCRPPQDVFISHPLMLDKWHRRKMTFLCPGDLGCAWEMQTRQVGGHLGAVVLLSRLCTPPAIPHWCPAPCPHPPLKGLSERWSGPASGTAS